MTISYLMRYFARVACTNRAKQVETNLLHANIIMESFGNAMTIRNDNSSRFGKYIQLNFSSDRCMRSARISTYLLEKTRVVHQNELERNFHVFYQVLAGASEAQRAAWNLTSDLYLNYFGDEMKNTSANLNDLLKWKILNESFDYLKLNCGLDDIFKLISVVLHLNSVKFRKSEIVENSNGDDERIVIEEKSEKSLAIAAEILGLDLGELRKKLAVREIAIQEKEELKFEKFCSMIEAKNRRDCMSKIIYSSLFSWIIRCLNEALNSDDEFAMGDEHSTISLLDIYGFEDVNLNSLEQLCINYANEKLQQLFVGNYLKATQENYVREGIEWHHISYQDNSELLNTIDASLFAILDEECQLKKRNEITALELASKILKRIGNGNHLSQAGVKKRRSSFVIRHYAGDVAYVTESLIEKNRDEIPVDLFEFLTKSGNRFFGEIIEETLKARKRDSLNKKHPTVTAKFKRNVDELIRKLEDTNIEFIRCIKPNDLFDPKIFDRESVARQLEASGIISTINIGQKGYTTSLTYPQFFVRYETIFREYCKVSGIRAKIALPEQSGKSSAEQQQLSVTVSKETIEETLMTNSSIGNLNEDSAAIDFDINESDNNRVRCENYEFDSKEIVDDIKMKVKEVLEKVVMAMKTNKSFLHFYQFGENRIFLKEDFVFYLNDLNQRREHEAARKIQKYWRAHRRKNNLRKAFDRAKFVLKRTTSAFEVSKQRRSGNALRKVVSQPNLQHLQKEIVSLSDKSSVTSLSTVDIHFEKHGFCQSSKCELSAPNVIVFYANPSSTVLSRRVREVLHLSMANAL